MVYRDSVTSLPQKDRLYVEGEIDLEDGGSSNSSESSFSELGYEIEVRSHFQLLSLYLISHALRREESSSQARFLSLICISTSICARHSLCLTDISTQIETIC